MKKVSEYVTVADAARIIGVSQNTLRKWAECGKVRVRRNPANGYRLFLKEDLRSFLGAIERAATPKGKPKG